MEISHQIITEHGSTVILLSLLICSFLAIAILLLKNRKENLVIKDEKYTDPRKRSDVIIDKNNIQTTDRKSKKDGYQPKNYRGTDIETAAWEDAGFEQDSGKLKESTANVLDDIQTPENDAPQSEAEEQAKRFKEISGKINNVSRSLMNEIITELRENRVQGINSAIESDSFAKKIEKKEHRQNRAEDLRHNNSGKGGGRAA